MKRETLQSIIVFLMKIITRLEFSGLEHIPTEGGVLMATNHMSRLDIPVLLVNPVRSDITGIIADKYETRSYSRFIIETLEGIWIDRSKADFSAFRDARKLLQKGIAMGIAPEGTRSDSARLLEGKPGTALLAVLAGVPVVPVGIVGTENTGYLLKRLRRSPIKVHFGPPIHLPPLERENRDEFLYQATEEIMCQIAILLPEKYHGFYTGHPRVKELLALENGKQRPPGDGVNEQSQTARKAMSFR